MSTPNHQPEGEGVAIPDSLAFHPDAQDVDIRVYAAFKSYGQSTDPEVFPGRAAVAEQLGKSLRTVASSISRLSRLGYLEVVHQADPETGVSLPSLYRTLDGPKPEAAA